MKDLREFNSENPKLVCWLSAAGGTALKGCSVSLSHKDQTQHSVFSWMFMHFYVRFRLFGSSIALKTLKQTHLMDLNLKKRSKPRNQHPNTASVSITYNMSSKAYFDPKNAVFGP